MYRTIKTVALIALNVAIVIFTLLSLGVDIFHAVEEIFYDHQATIFTNSAFSRLTNKACLFAAILCLFSTPFYIIKLYKKDYEIPKMIYSLKYIATVLLILVFLMVMVVLFPAVWVSEGFKESIKVNFLGDCLFTHLLIPFTFVLSFLFLDEKCEFSKREEVAIYIILGTYVLLYIFFVYVFKTWEDFYFINMIISYVTIFGYAGIALLVLPIPYLLNKLVYKIKKK